ncbi:MAG: alpha-glucuronidase [Bacteroidales bacterium]|nr:alpha-glucuronidase [Bacteroidales bacterium]
MKLHISSAICSPLMLAVALGFSSCDRQSPVSPFDAHSLWFQQHKAGLHSDNKAHVIINDSTPTLRIVADEMKDFSIADAVSFNIVSDEKLGHDGYDISLSGSTVTVSANSDVALLYAAFDLLRQQHVEVGSVRTHSSVPSYDFRMLNHWDNLDGTVERGYAGHSIWQWRTPTPEDIKIYTEYARANASVGINTVVLNNVNASPEMLSAEHIKIVAQIADILRPYGIRVLVSVNFSSPMVLAGLPDADPLRDSVRQWWKDKADEIYSLIPDFAGFLVKANSEGLPGPLDYHRSHSDGANMLAEALKPHGGIVLWRAFVYSPSDADRAKQAYLEFQPLDGQFLDNVIIQIKNGPIDFQPREPFSPLFGALKKTQMAAELQITQEYTGAANHLCYLPTMWLETLNADTYRDGQGSTIARLTQDKLPGVKVSAIAGVANIGNDDNWCGNHIAQSNWYAFGRMAWDTNLTADSIATEWIRQTMPDIPRHAESTVRDMLIESREAVVDYMMPLGLHHIFAWGHHYGPEPWCAVPGARPDWMPTYYHCADSVGLGSRRDLNGSKAVLQYNAPLSDLYADVNTCPDEYLLWFHHVNWDFRMKNGRTLWDELCVRYDHGLAMTVHFLASWNRVQSYVDANLWNDVQHKLEIQHDDARWWHDGCLLYFQQFSKMPIPQKTIYNLDDMMKFHINITNYENAKQGYRGEKLVKE